MKKSRINKITALFLAVFIVLLGSTILASRADWRYMLSEITRKPDDDMLPKKISIENNELEEYSYEQIGNDERFEMNDSLMLINGEYTLPEAYIPELIAFGDAAHKISGAIPESYLDLVSAVKTKTGEDLIIVSSYRTAEEQRRTIEEEGERAAEVNASEHLTGLALDVCVQNYGGESFSKSQAGRFVNSYCGDCGFIIRYPMFSKGLTGIGYEPWHIRYVGLPHSKIIYGAKLRLEEYINYFEVGEFYRYDEYIITRQPKDEISLPKNFKSAEISEDNTGYCILTLLTD